MGGFLSQVKAHWELVQTYLDTETTDFCVQSIKSGDELESRVIYSIGSEMTALAELAIARLVLSNPTDPGAHAIASLYAERQNLKDSDFGEGSQSEITCNDLYAHQPEIRADGLIWLITLYAKLEKLHLRWGQAFVNIESGRSELLLDNRPKAWTGSDVMVNGYRLGKLKLLDGSFTKKAIEILDKEYQSYFKGGRSIQSYGGWLKDANRKQFQFEFAYYKEQNPSASDDDASQHAIRKTSFGKARVELGISEFNILLWGKQEATDLKGLGMKVVPSKILILNATRPKK